MDHYAGNVNLKSYLSAHLVSSQCSYILSQLSAIKCYFNKAMSFVNALLRGMLLAFQFLQ